MTHDLHVHHLQLRPARAPTGRNGPALKTALAQALRTVRLRGAHLPPGAVLVVRRLDALPPFPRQAGDVAGWQRQLVAHLDRLAASAAHPAREHVPAGARAVLFADEVELLLCYTRDLLTARSRWYWHILFPGSLSPADPAGGPLVAAWVAYARALPATLAALEPVEARRALAGLGPRPLARLAHALHHTFGLPADLPLPAPAGPTGNSGTPPAANAPAGSGADAVISNSKSASTGPPPWQQVLPPALHGALPPGAAYVAGLCYTLFHHPQRARDPHFTREAAAWLAGAPAPAEIPPPPIPRRAERPSGPSPAPLSGPPPGLPRPTPAPGARPEPIAPPSSRPNPTPSFPKTPGVETGIPTRLGGAFYLVNLLTRLPLPGTLAALNPWELLLALTAALLGQRYLEYGHDPLWSLLCDLARLDPDERWGAALPSPPDRFHLPPSWPVPAAATAAYPDPGRREQHLLPPPLSARLAPPLAWWLTHLLPPLHAGMRQLLGDPEWEPETFLNRPATVAVTRTHVDVRFSLEDVDMRARRAGLDRDPGWQPAYARIITFHFVGGPP